MKISHIALYTNNLEQSKNFYCLYFKAKANQKYINAATGFESYFLSFEHSDCILEIMYKPGKTKLMDENSIGLAHFAISVGSKNNVELLTSRLQADGYKINTHPRKTGDGYFESVILDPDGNLIEITI